MRYLKAVIQLPSTELHWGRWRAARVAKLVSRLRNQAHLAALREAVK
jgi:hypothetical protein